MERKFRFIELNGGYWGRIISISMVLFFVYLGDAVLSDWVPSYIQSSMGNSFLMGLVMSFSSLVGFSADLVFPQLLRGTKTRKLVVLAIGASLVFCGILFWTVSWPVVPLFLLAMAVWGIYYEFLGFGSYQFVAESVPADARSGAWAVMGVFRSMAYFLGPIVGAWLLLKGNAVVVIVSAVIVVLGYVFFVLSGINKSGAVLTEPLERVHLWQEIKRWWTLSEHVWPVLTISLVLGVIDATFWTAGTVLSDELAKTSSWGGMFLPLYTLPMVFVGVLVARWGIYKGKKKMAEVFMLISGLILAMMSVVNSSEMMLLIAFLSGCALSVSWPLVDAVYSDIVSRMKTEGKHMVGLSGSTISLAYIVGPIIAGYITLIVDEKMTFAVIGVVTTVIAAILLIVTPKKIKLPQEEIKTWD